MVTVRVSTTTNHRLDWPERRPVHLPPPSIHTNTELECSVAIQTEGGTSFVACHMQQSDKSVWIAYVRAEIYL